MADRTLFLNRKHCVFCLEAPSNMTNEHVWGDWVTSHLPKTSNKHTLPDKLTEADRRPNTQTTAFSLGELFAFVMSSEIPGDPPGLGLADRSERQLQTSPSLANTAASATLAARYHDRRGGKGPILSRSLTTWMTWR